MKFSSCIKTLAAAFLIGSAGVASAGQVDAAFTVTGTSGDWTLNFDVFNHLESADVDRRDQSLYFFGVDLDGATVVSGPAGFDSTLYPTWSNANFGGSDTVYDATWGSWGHVAYPGQDLSGFVIHSDAIDAPTAVSWFAYFSGSEFLGSGYFNNSYNPGFEGSAGVVPEPGSTALLLAGLGLVGVMAARRKTQA